MKTRGAATAQRLMNLYRGAHAIDGGWAAVNAALVAESDDAAAAEIAKLPCGSALNAHIANLKSGRTRMDSIAPELLPYNGMLSRGAAAPSAVDAAEYAELRAALESFAPDAEHVGRVKRLALVRRFGDNWPSGVRAILRDGRLLEIWTAVLRADGALRYWNRAAEILGAANPTEFMRAEVQADLPEYETYLPVFGASGADVLTRLRRFVL